MRLPSTKPFIAAIMAAALAAAAPGDANAADPAPAASPWRIGMSAAFSGPAEALGAGMRDGVLAYFAAVNARGGVHGRPLELVARDDAYEPARTAPNMRALADEDHVFAVIGNVGTPTAAVAVPIADEKHLPLFGAFTGAGLLRKSPPDRYVVNFRASYAEETAEMVRGLVTELGIRPEQIGFFTQNDAYGDAGWKGAVAALERLGYADAANLPHGRYPRNTVDVEAGLAELLDPRVDVRAVIMVGAYKPCARFIQLAKAYDFAPYFLNVSFVGSDALAGTLGADGDGVVITQVVPLPDGDTAAARELQATVPAEKRNFVTFEGFLAAKAFVAALERAGADATPESFLDAVESGAPFDLGLGVEHRLSKAEHQFSHRVWPTVIRGGRFVALARWTDLLPQESAR
ncbi:MAG: ABC transporter substrate-binding protein [Myxococcales bacterium]|nr:ABC transporter substrate-binding protein [Myxococcales bacterium]